MKPIVIVAVLLIVLGAVGLASGRIGYSTKEKVLDLGPIEATVEEKHAIAIPEIAGILAIVGGVVLLVFGTRRA